jgi:hypothetical protein
MHVDLEGMFPFLVGNVFNGLEYRLMRGIVDENVDDAKVVHAPLDQGAAMRRVCVGARNPNTAEASNGCIFSSHIQVHTVGSRRRGFPVR